MTKRTIISRVIVAGGILIDRITLDLRAEVTDCAATISSSVLFQIFSRIRFLGTATTVCI